MLRFLRNARARFNQFPQKLFVESASSAGRDVFKYLFAGASFAGL
jgi:hypothetical protein